MAPAFAFSGWKITKFPGDARISDIGAIISLQLIHGRPDRCITMVRFAFGGDVYLSGHTDSPAEKPSLYHDHYGSAKTVFGLIEDIIDDAIDRFEARLATRTDCRPPRFTLGSLRPKVPLRR